MTLQAAEIEEKIKTSKHPTVVSEKAQGQDCTELLWSKDQMQSKTIKGGSSQQLRKKQTIITHNRELSKNPIP